MVLREGLARCRVLSVVLKPRGRPFGLSVHGAGTRHVALSLHLARSAEIQTGLWACESLSVVLEVSGPLLLPPAG